MALSSFRFWEVLSGVWIVHSMADRKIMQAKSYIRYIDMEKALPDFRSEI